MEGCLQLVDKRAVCGGLGTWAQVDSEWMLELLDKWALKYSFSNILLN